MQPNENLVRSSAKIARQQIIRPLRIESVALSRRFVSHREQEARGVPGAHLARQETERRLVSVREAIKYFEAITSKPLPPSVVEQVSRPGMRNFMCSMALIGILDSECEEDSDDDQRFVSSIAVNRVVAAVPYRLDEVQEFSQACGSAGAALFAYANRGYEFCYAEPMP